MRAWLRPVNAFLVLLTAVAAFACFDACDSSGGASGAARSSASTAKSSARGVIVVLGSSTAAGQGPRRESNAWVERYRAHLEREFPGFELINLAVGGYTTYHIQPSDYAPPPNRPVPDKKRNISSALAAKPDAIIVNMPSNDQQHGFATAEQLTNYERVAGLAKQKGVLFWVATSQPRNFTGDQPDVLRAKRAGLFEARDELLRKYPGRTLDFWTTFANPDGALKRDFDSGDGTHLNDAAHALLVQRVINARIPEAILASRQPSSPP